MKNNNFINVALVSGLAIMGVVFAPVARAGEGGIAGSAAFTVNTDGKVTGVAVSSAVGKQDAAAHAFNYGTSGTIQNAAFAIGSAGTITGTDIGGTTTAGTSYNTMADSNLGSIQGNKFNAGTVGIKLGTTSGNSLVDAPTSSAPATTTTAP
ncbi:MAG: hypothetical protein ACRC2J_00830 [Microcoleaceae cyanobacterium]